MSQKKRAWLGMAFWAVPQLAVYIWTAILYSQFQSHNLKGVDYTKETGTWFRLYIPYFIIRKWSR